VVEVSASVAVSAVFTHQSLKVVHGEEFFILVSGRIEEDTKIDVDHLIIPHEEGGRGEIGLFTIVLRRLGGRKRQGLGGIDHFLVVDIATDRKDGVVCGVVLLHKFLDGGLGDVGQVFTDSQDRLTHEVVSVRGVMHGF